MIVVKKKAVRILTILSVVLVSLALAVIVVVQFAPKPMIEADYPYYPDVRSITNAADVIVVGKVTSARDVQGLIIDRTPNNLESVHAIASTIIAK